MTDIIMPRLHIDFEIELTIKVHENGGHLSLWSRQDLELASLHARSEVPTSLDCDPATRFCQRALLPPTHGVSLQTKCSLARSVNLPRCQDQSDRASLIKRNCSVYDDFSGFPIYKSIRGAFVQSLYSTLGIACSTGLRNVA
jgi:hypothetical protein